MQLNNLGGGGDRLQVQVASQAGQLRELVEETSTGAGLPLLDKETSLSPIQPIVTRRIPLWASFGWATDGILPAGDTLAKLDRDKLQAFGEMFALLMTNIVRESRL